LGAPIHQPTQAEGRKPLGIEHNEVPSTKPARSVSPKDGYRLSSRCYDAEPNPMLPLEQRFLERLLPSVTGLDVVDLGCGTGRWLETLARRSPGSLVGVDLSREMLSHARRKIGDAAKLVVADCLSLPLPRSCADLVLCAFLMSYVEDIVKFAEQVRRILRPRASVFITDLHPVTTSVLDWRRGFHVDGSFVEIATYSRSIEQLVSCFEAVGIHTDAVLEPPFGEPEFEVLKRAGKTETFHAASDHPAIYILQLGVKTHRSSKRGTTLPIRTLKQLTGARVAVGAQESTPANIYIEDGRIRSLGRGGVLSRTPASEGKRSVDLSGFLLLPGLVNAHDHLEFALFPRLGKGGYNNFVEWAEDIYRPGSPPISEHQSVPKNTRLWWGGIRNLLSGVTTVCHHNPYVEKLFSDGFAVRVLRDFAWAHSVPMDHDFVQKRKNADPDQPFIIHLAEGVDLQSAEEIGHLVRKQALNDRTVLVHGIGLDARGMSLLRARGAALVWCPTSNVFLFGRTHTRETIQALPRVALGSDSPLTAHGDLLDEVRFARVAVGIPAEALYALVTTSAAQVLRLKNGEGTLRIGAFADLIGVRDAGLSPADTLATTSCHDVELVIVAGQVQLASSDVLTRLPRSVTTGLRPLQIDGQVRWVRAPLNRLFSETQRHLPGEIKLGGRRVGHGLTA
jgi:cytosine/adenosine deaminase-related metal-dependent hydrolase/SAM-dependent methyltransferase